MNKIKKVVQTMYQYRVSFGLLVSAILMFTLLFYFYLVLFEVRENMINDYDKQDYRDIYPPAEEVILS